MRLLLKFRVDSPEAPGDRSSLLFLIGVRGSSLTGPSSNILISEKPASWCSSFNRDLNDRLIAGVVMSFNAWRAREGRLSFDLVARGVKNLRNEFGVTGGGFLGLVELLPLDAGAGDDDIC